MNKKYYLLTMLLITGMITHFHIDAKSTSSHVATKAPNTLQKNTQTNNEAASESQGEVVSRPKIGQIQFSGNSKISSDDLKKGIPLKVQDIANENIIMDSMVKIAQLYKTKNIKVTITPVLEKTSPTVTNIHFDIHEMPMSEK